MTHRTTWNLASTVFIGMALVGCSAELGQTSHGDASRTLELVGTEAGLALEGAPAAPGYEATYPNPELLERMQVRLLPDGELDVSCVTGGAHVACGDAPFLVEKEVAEGVLWVRVWDLYGAMVLQEQLGSAQAALRFRPDDEDEGDFHVPEFPDDGDGDSPRTPDDGGGSEPPPPDDGFHCPRPDEKAWFCEEVNLQLARIGITDYTIDCADVPDDFSFDFTPPADETRIRRCGDVLDPVEDMIEDYFEDRDDICGELQLEAWAENTRLIMISDAICRSSPLVLDLDGDGVKLGSVHAGVSFDLLGEGRPVQTAWPSAGDAFLALDRNGNGVVDDATELFGNATDGRRFTDGFEALATLDGNGDGSVDGADPAFASLVVWRDDNQNGVCGKDELTSLRATGIRRLHLEATAVEGSAATDAHGNRIPLVSRFEREDGRRGALVDVWLRFRPLDDGAVAHGRIVGDPGSVTMSCEPELASRISATTTPATTVAPAPTAIHGHADPSSSSCAAPSGASWSGSSALPSVASAAPPGPMAFAQ